MACKPTNSLSELQFVQALLRRSCHGECQGPALHLVLDPQRVFRLDRIMQSNVASDVLWSGFIADSAAGPEFALCAAHWFDLACLAWARAIQFNKLNWSAEAEDLLQDLCFVAQWDAKEIVNMFAWQRARLT
jgi:hypothetical protein